MTCRRIAALLLIVTLNISATVPAHAQSAADADNAMRAMQLRMRALNVARKSLQQTAQHRDASETDALLATSDADVAVFAAAVKVFTVAFMLSGMKCPEDLRFAQKQFRLVVASFIAEADPQLGRVDQSLPNIKTPAARSDATQIREAITELRDLLKPFAAAE